MFRPTMRKFRKFLASRDIYVRGANVIALPSASASASVSVGADKNFNFGDNFHILQLVRDIF